jgi:hypothetical protein
MPRQPGFLRGEVAERDLLSSNAGIFTAGGKYFATGSSSFTSPRRAMSHASSAVKTLVQEPISKTVSPSAFASVPLSSFPMLNTRVPLVSTSPITIPALLPAKLSFSSASIATPCASVNRSSAAVA